MAGLAFVGVQKSFGERKVLTGFDLEVGDGELVTLVGPSGSGKSTSLRIAAGLESAGAGEVRIGGLPVDHLPPSRRGVAMVFQSPALLPHLDVGGNIGVGLSIRRTPRAEIRRRVAEAAALVDCADLLERRAWELSGGEAQRIALARALVREPDVFLLDEPLSSLDAALRTALRSEVRALQRRLGATMLSVTHDQTEALALGDRVAVLLDGAVRQIATADELYRRPRSRAVAEFVGTARINVIAATHGGGGLDADPFRVASERLSAGLGDGRYMVGVRPEDVRLAEPGPSPFTVEGVEVTGAEAMIHLERRDRRLLARVPAAARPGEGDSVGVRAKPAAALVFDAATGETVSWTA